MPAKGTRKCKDCDRYFDPEVDDVRFAADGSIRCWSCFEASEQYAHMMKVYGGDTYYEEPRTVVFDEDFIYWDSEEMDDEPFPAPVVDVVYHSTDAWRGYYEPSFEDGWVDFARGWATGWPDETVSHKVQFNELMERLNRGDIVPPCELVFVFCHSSNVFSTGVDAVVREEDEPLLMAWLAEVGCDIEEALR